MKRVCFFFYHTGKGSTVRQKYDRDSTIKRGCDGLSAALSIPARAIYAFAVRSLLFYIKR